MRTLVILFLASTGLAGCVPFPRYTEIRPETVIRVVDEQGAPVPDADVLFVVGSNPHGVLDHRLELVTDGDGRVFLDSRKQWDWIMPFMIHGIAFYYRAWCVEKPGFLPAVAVVHDPDAPVEHELTMVPGSSDAECRNEGGYVYVEH